MATPTASGKPTPGYGGQTPFTPGAGSPSSHANKTTRSPVSQMKRSRADTLRGMEHSLSQQGATPRSSTLQGSSPSFLGTPSQSHGGPGLGVSTSTPGGGGGSGNTPGATAMQRGTSTSFGLSSLGIDAAIYNADREMFVRTKLAEIRNILSARWGQVSRVGVQRAAARLGLECLWESGENEEVGVLDVAGDGVLLQITFKGEAVEDTQLSFPEADTSGRLREPDDDKRGSLILKKDLQGWDNEQYRGFYTDLDRFGTDMQHLADIDHLGKGGIRCFDAVDGFYRALKDVEGWWRKRPGFDNGFDVLAKGCGWARMHANGKVGARLDYWLHMWMTKKSYLTEEPFAVPTHRDLNLYGVRIGVMPQNIASDTFITPTRISSNWFDFLDDIPVDATDGAGGTPGQFPPLQLQRKEPDPTYPPSAEVGGADENGDGIARPLLNTVFKAFFDPPIPISYPVSTALLGQHAEGVQSYASLLIDDKVKVDLQRPDLVLRMERNVFYPPSDSSNHIKFSISNSNALPAFLLRELPLSHPMDLLTVLPVLRQWAWLHGVLSKSLGVQVRVHSKRSGASTAATTNGGPPLKKNGKHISAQQVRAIIKAGGTWAPSSDTESSDDDDDKDDNKGRQAQNWRKTEYDETVDISLEMPEALDADGNPITPTNLNMSIMIPVGDGKNPVMADLCLSPGPRLTPIDDSEGDDFVRRIATILEGAEDFSMLVMWVRDQKSREREEENGAEQDGESSYGDGNDGNDGKGGTDSQDEAMKDV